MRYLYTVLFYLLLPFVFLRLLWRSRHQVAYRQRWAERLGYCPHRLSQCLWVHAASVGEIIAAVPLINALIARYPDLPILVTNMTITGAIRTQAIFGERVLSAYVPYDVPSAVQRFLKRVHPVMAIIVETELWPNLFAACQQANIPIVVANARLSEKSAKGYQRVASVTRTLLSAVTAIGVQTQVEAERFIALGLPPERLMVTGSIKFDAEIPEAVLKQAEALRAAMGEDRLIWIAASTHAGEEDIMLAAHQQLCERIPNALLILVPRHPERFDTVATLIEKQALSYVRRSVGDVPGPQTQVYLADTMGELVMLYATCDVAFVGGSLVPVGGHNMLEAALLAKPILVGPTLFNFAEISAMLFQAQGMLAIQDVDSLVKILSDLLQDATYRQTIGQNAYRLAESNKGALVKHLVLIEQAGSFT